MARSKKQEQRPQRRIICCRRQPPRMQTQKGASALFYAAAHAVVHAHFKRSRLLYRKTVELQERNRKKLQFTKADLNRVTGELFRDLKKITIYKKIPIYIDKSKKKC